MEPPLKSQGCGLHHLRQLARVARSLSTPNHCDPLIENCRARRNGDMPSHGAPTRLCADRRTGLGLRHVLSLPRRRVRFGPTQSPRQNASLAFGVCHSALLLSALPVTGAGGAFLPRQGLGVFRHARVSGKRSQTLNSLGGNTLWLTRNPLMKSGSVASRRQFGRMAPRISRGTTSPSRASTKRAINGRVRRASGATTCWCFGKWPTSPTRASCELPQEEDAEAEAES